MIVYRKHFAVVNRACWVLPAMFVLDFVRPIPVTHVAPPRYRGMTSASKVTCSIPPYQAHAIFATFLKIVRTSFMTALAQKIQPPSCRRAAVHSDNLRQLVPVRENQILSSIKTVSHWRLPLRRSQAFIVSRLFCVLPSKPSAHTNGVGPFQRASLAERRSPRGQRAPFGTKVCYLNLGVMLTKQS
jgi:hypothetical protein